VLDFLVTSKARRRMLLLLFGEGASGSATELAKRARVGFAGAYRELRAMRAIGIAVAGRGRRGQTYRANRRHPLAGALKALVTAPTLPLDAEGDRRTRGQLIALGAPLFGSPRPVVSAEKALVRGVDLAHRDGTVAAVLPVCLYRQRDALDPERLAAHARRFGEGQAVGFLLDLTATLSGDRRFARWAARFRDRRRTGATSFFIGGHAARSRKVAERNTPPLARKWGLRMNLGLDAFSGTFYKHARA
jgi:hypothetical protein